MATSEAILGPDELEVVLRPRTGLVAERRVGDSRFEADQGPVRRYTRTLELQPLSEGQTRVVQTVDFSLNVPYFAFLFLIPFRRRVARIGPEPPSNPWWAPPQRLDSRGAAVLGTLAAVAIIFGYLNTLFTQTIAFAADEFHAGNGAQGAAGAVVRTGGLIALILTAAADRQGRRRILMISTLCGLSFAAAGALAPSLPWLTATQVLARAFANALLLVVGILVAEEMPAGSRAYGVSVLAMAGGLGAGLCVMALRLADLGLRGWRLAYLVPLLALPLAWDIGRRLPESRRFVTTHAASRRIGGHQSRLALLAISGFLLNVFVAPGSQFGNRFLHDERHYSGGRVALLTITTGTPAGIGVILGGRLADVRGRRQVGAIATALGAVLSTVFYFATGWGLWLWALFGSFVSDISIPALAVYGPELFPTSLRGKANGIINITALAGSAVGLTSVGLLADRFGRIGPAMAIAALGPLVLALLIITRYPETARMELEEINPEDRVHTDRPPDALPDSDVAS